MEKEELIDIAKRHCYITSKESTINDRFKIVYNNAIVKIKELIGCNENYDFNKPGLAQELLLNYCLYAWNDQISHFETNYMSDIQKCRRQIEVENYANKSSN